MNGTEISVHPLHLGLGATTQIEPAFTGAMEWYAINQAGIRHTADVAVATTALFITAGFGTEHRPR